MTTLRVEFLVAVCALGAVIGLFLGFILALTGLNATQSAGIWLPIWLSQPGLYWPWPAFGALIAALIFWVGALLRGH